MVRYCLIFIVCLYRKYISPLKKTSCRFYPTCSQYALDALERYGAISGTWRGLKRICRCHPFHPGGYDPVE
ncbi:MAG: membrane protein insertion efficiency factor YidD [Dethiobacter sp.]